MRFFYVILAFAGMLLADGVNLSSPENTVTSYYNAMNHGDIGALKQIMEPNSFDTDMQVYALSLAFKSPGFRRYLKGYHASEANRVIVQKAVAAKLAKRPERTISGLFVKDIGEARKLVRYTEDGKTKQLYVRLYGDEWKIDYKAGRPTR